MIQHCREAEVKAGRRIGLLKLVGGRRWGANMKTKLRLYKQYIRPVLEHGSVATAQACPTALERLGVVERRALRVITSLPPWTKIEELYLRAGVEPISERLERLRATAIQRFSTHASQADNDHVRACLR